MSQYHTDAQYNGEEKLVVAIDIGTTHTAVSYVHLCPTMIPKPRMVNKWPEQTDDSMKIPSIIAYQEGKVQACGAEANRFLNKNSYEIAKWFKLLLHPLHMNDATTSKEIPKLPSLVTVDIVYRDFLTYLWKCTRQYFIESTNNGLNIWNHVQEDGIFVVFAIPNGWDTRQQGTLRVAAQGSGWVRPRQTFSNISFVTESEASVHYTLEHQNSNWLAAGIQFLVLDAGGSTVDSTLYECTSKTPKLVLKEVCASKSILAGGIYVDRAMRGLLERKLANSKYRTEKLKQKMTDIFEKTIKRRWNGSQNDDEIDFGCGDETDPNANIYEGALRLSDAEIKSTFRVVANIKRECRELLRNTRVEYVILVGGFGDSPYLRKRLELKLGKTIVTANEPLKKAAAEGTTIWYLKGLVAARAARYSFGVKCSVPYDADLPSHRARTRSRFTDSEGVVRIRNSFSILVEKNDIIKSGYTVFEDYFRLYYHDKPANLDYIETDILAYDGNDFPQWCADEEGEFLPGFRKECTIQADLSSLYPLLESDVDENGDAYWRIDYQVGIQFGGTELKAILQWGEGGTVHQSPAKILADSTSYVIHTAVETSRQSEETSTA